MPLLDIANVSTGYNNVPILEDVTIEIESGELVGVIGPNGAGKSTLFKLVMGYLEPWSGSISFNDRSIEGVTPSDLVREGIAYVPQTDNVFPQMTVEENLRMGGFTLDKRELTGKLSEVYELFPTLSERKSQRVRTMSGGERKMVAVARAMITNPSLFLFDEPSAGLMPKYVNDIFDTLERINEQRNTSFLIIEQQVQTVLEHTDRTYVLRDGKVQLNNRSETLLRSEEHREVYLGGSQSG